MLACARNYLCKPWAIVLTAFALRLLFVSSFYLYDFSRNPREFSFGFESAEVGRSLASLHSFSSPCPIDTGTTAMVPPVYPFLIAAVFKLFGTYSLNSGLVLLTLNCLFSSLVCIPILEIGRRTFGAMAGVLAAWGWVFWPMAFWESRLIWESSLSALLFAVTFLFALRYRSSPKLSVAVALGLVSGVTALVNPAILAFMVPFLAYETYVHCRSAKELPRDLLATTAVLVVVLLPWMGRNYLRFRRLIPIRDNFWYELYIGNYPSVQGENRYQRHFCSNRFEALKVQQTGEIAYIDFKKREVLAFIETHPSDFVRASAKRVLYFWAGTKDVWLDGPSSGSRHLSTFLVWARHIVFVSSSILGLWGIILGFHRKTIGIHLFMVMLCLVPLAYYITHAENRYRHPIEPLLMVVAAAPLATYRQRKNESMSSQADLEAAAAA